MYTTLLNYSTVLTVTNGLLVISTKFRVLSHLIFIYNIQSSWWKSKKRKIEKYKNKKLTRQQTEK